MKSRTHTVLVTVTFDKPCSRGKALRELQDTIYGTEYCTELDAGDPSEYRVRSVKMPKASQSPRRPWQSQVLAQ